MATAARPEMGPRQNLPLQPRPRQLCRAMSQPAGDSGLGLGPAHGERWGTVSCCLSPAGVGAVVAGLSNNPFLTHVCQLAQFGFTGGLGGWWDGAAHAPAAPHPHGAQCPRSHPIAHPRSPWHQPPCLSFPIVKSGMTMELQSLSGERLHFGY